MLAGKRTIDAHDVFPAKPGFRSFGGITTRMLIWQSVTLLWGMTSLDCVHMGLLPAWLGHFKQTAESSQGSAESVLGVALRHHQLCGWLKEALEAVVHIVQPPENLLGRSSHHSLGLWWSHDFQILDLWAGKTSISNQPR